MSVTSEQILNSVSTVVNEALSTYKQDQTIIAKVEEEGSGKILVSSGALKFYAYGEDDKSYNKSQQVYVLIPQGDYSQKKIILGAYSIEDEDKKIYKSSNKLKDYIQTTAGSTIKIPYSAKYDAAAITLTPKVTDDISERTFSVNFRISSDDGKVLAQGTFSKDMIRGSLTLNPAIKYDFLYNTDETVDSKGTWSMDLSGNDKDVETLNELFDISWSFGYTSPDKQIKAFFPETYKDSEYGYLEVIGDAKAATINNANLHEIVAYTYQIGSGESAAGTNWKQVAYYNNKISGSSLVNSEAFGEKGCRIELTNLLYNNAENTKFKFRATLTDSDEWIESDIITVKNPDKSTITAEAVNGGITLSLLDGDTGVYNCYGLDCYIKNDDDKVTRYVQVTQNGEVKEEIASVDWEYPTYLTGIEVLETQEEKDKLFYKIKRRCQSSYTNNTIKCTVTFANGSTAQASITLTFGGYGTQETPYSLNVDYVRDKKYLVSGEGPVRLRATLERTDGEAAITDGTFKWEWLEDYSTVIFCDEEGNAVPNPEGEEVYVLPPTFDNIGNYNSIVKVTVKDVTINDIASLDLVGYLPLSFCAESADTAQFLYQGPVRIVYDSLNDCSYDSSDIKVYRDGKEVAIDTEKTCIGTYSGKSYSTNKILDYAAAYGATITSHYLTFSRNSESILLSPKTYTMINDEPTVDTIYIHSGSGLLWAQPLLTIRNRWTNTFYSWDGKSTSSTDDMILTPFLAAGKLESGRTFTGTMIGENKDKDKDSSVWGLFGYQSGSPRYYFTEDGEAFIGNSENKYGIELDKSGELDISVNKFLLDTPTLKIDSDNKTIKIFNNSNSLKLSLGQVRTNVFGIDVYSGSFIVYSKDYYDGIYNDDDAKSLYFKTENGTVNMYLNGKIQRKPSQIYDSGVFDYKMSDVNYKGRVKADNKIEIGEISNLGLTGFAYNDSSVPENYLTGLVQTSKILVSNSYAGSIDSITNLEPDVNSKLIGGKDNEYYEKFSYFYQGFLGGKSSVIDAGKYKSDNWIKQPSKYIQMVNSSYEAEMVIAASSDNTSSYGSKLKLAASVGDKKINNSLETSSTIAQISCEVHQNNDGGNDSYIYMDATVLSSNSTSDARYKKNIENLSESYDAFFNLLKPVRYQYTFGTSNRFHTGFIAQEIVKALEQTDLTSQDFAGFMLTKKDTEEERYYLRRDEFVALNTWQIQKLKVRVAELEDEIKEIKNEINK